MNGIIQQAYNAGFTHAVPLDPKTVHLKPEVRQMCASNRCGQYGRRWSCPPACGSLASGAKRIAAYRQGILVQTVGTLEDELDGEGMMAAQALHKEQFAQLHVILKHQFPHLLALGAGCCTVCKNCTYPDAPCRYPEKQLTSMEAYGIEVTQVCRENSLSYYYGPLTITYTGCFLLD